MQSWLSFQLICDYLPVKFKDHLVWCSLAGLCTQGHFGNFEEFVGNVNILEFYESGCACSIPVWIFCLKYVWSVGCSLWLSACCFGSVEIWTASSLCLISSVIICFLLHSAYVSFKKCTIKGVNRWNSFWVAWCILCCVVCYLEE